SLMRTRGMWGSLPIYAARSLRAGSAVKEFMASCMIVVIEDRYTAVILGYPISYRQWHNGQRTIGTQVLPVRQRRGFQDRINLVRRLGDGITISSIDPDIG